MLLSTTRRAVSAAPGVGRRGAHAIALKYSKAVYSAALAKSPQTLTKVHSELAAVASTIKSNPDVASFISNPTLSSQDRAAGLSTFFTNVSKKEPVSDITKNLLTLLSENGRLTETAGVIEGFNELVAQYKGELTVTVTSATPLPKDILTRLETTLKGSQAGQQAKVLKITNKVCDSLLLPIICSHPFLGESFGFGRHCCGLRRQDDRPQCPITRHQAQQRYSGYDSCLLVGTHTHFVLQNRFKPL